MPRHKQGNARNGVAKTNQNVGKTHKAKVNDALHNLPNGRTVIVDGISYRKTNGKAIRIK